MNVNDLFPSRYLKASDATPPLTLTISAIQYEKLKNREGKEEEKPIIFFKEQQKGMVLNRTNANLLTNLFGEETNNWIGERVILGTEMVTAFGETNPALRFKGEPEPTYDPKKLMAAYLKLYDEARELGVENLETFVVPADSTAEHLIEMGKELRAAVKEAKSSPFG